MLRYPIQVRRGDTLGAEAAEIVRQEMDDVRRALPGLRPARAGAAGYRRIKSRRCIYPSYRSG